LRDLNLGPDSRKLIEAYKRQAYDKELAAALAGDMARMLERWIDVAWCWVDAAPARICGGPHVRVKYQHDRMGQDPKPIEIIEPIDHVGETFQDVPYTIIK
jgi:hypothetical protein